MLQPGAVTGWLDGLRLGDDLAAQRLWEEYFRRLVGLAQARLRGRQRGPDEPEDVALSAFDSFCRGAALGRFPRLNDRHDLWQVLVMITARKAIDAVRRENAAKRQDGNARGHELPSLEEVVDREPSPAFAAEVADECRRLLEKIDDPIARAVALDKLEGYTNLEIADRLKRSVATIERKLALIRQAWEEPDDG